MTTTLLQGDCRELLLTLPDRSVQCCVTSPPYFGLRNYEGNPAQIGLEQTPAAYVAALVAVFREVRRVLRDDGTCWINLGDSYCANYGMGGKGNTGGAQSIDKRGLPGLKPKDLIGIPWRVAFALQDDGWYLRSDIIWHKPNPMPESVTDRPTKAHEYLFLLAKSEKYYYDAAAIAEAATQPVGVARLTGQHKADAGGFTTNGHGNSTLGANQGATTRNRRTVWTIATRPYADAHFATFPEALVEPCILAGSAAQACPHCGAAWGRVVEHTNAESGREPGASEYSRRDPKFARGGAFTGAQSITLGHAPTCACPDNDGSGRSIVLDPFMGSGTVARVAERFQRDSIGIDLSYSELQAKRTDKVQVEMFV